MIGLIQKVEALALEYDMLPAGETVLCAVSGGADSMCLLRLLQELGEREGFSVAAAHFNHRLRGGESDRDAAFVEARCKAWNIPFLLGEGDVAGEAARQSLGIEETARKLRYAFLQKSAGALGAARIATAHSADDNVETLLLHLVRGAGLQGLTGIPPRRGEIVRPLLTASRSEIMDFVQENDIPFVEDSSNESDVFARNRLRHQVVPVLREMNPQLTERLSETIRLLRVDNDFLNAQAAQACLAARWAEDDLVIEARIIAELPNAVAPRAVRRLFEMMGDGDSGCTAAHLDDVVALCRGEDPSAVVFLPGGRLAQRVYRELLLTTQAEPLPPLKPVRLNLEGETLLEGWRVTCGAAICPDPAVSRPDCFYLDRAKLDGGPLFRARAVGDELRLPHRPGRKTVKKLLIDAKVPRRVRERVPVLADRAGVIAVAGFGPDESRLAGPGEAAYFVRIEREHRKG